MVFVLILSVIFMILSVTAHIYHTKCHNNKDARSLKTISVALFVLAYIPIFIAYGFDCHYKEKSKVELYLNTKYVGINFTYVSEGSDSWTKYYTYIDEDGNQFMVRDWDNKRYIDNYRSVLLDYEATNKKLKDEYPSDFKLFVDTQSFAGATSKRFENYNDYLKKCYNVNACVYTTKSPDKYNEIVEILSKQFKEYAISVDVYTLSEETYNSKDSYERFVSSLHSRSYLIVNGNVENTKE